MRPQSGVTIGVLFQILRTCECLLALETLERLHSWMQLNMTSIRIFVLKHHIAYRAFISFLFLVVSLHMTSKISFVLICSRTDCTSNRASFNMNSCLMRNQSFLDVERHRTFIALEITSFRTENKSFKFLYCFWIIWDLL